MRRGRVKGKMHIFWWELGGNEGGFLVSRNKFLILLFNFGGK
jgi:hypothetical protein